MKTGTKIGTEIAGNDCTVHCSNRGTAAEFWEVILWYLPLREWLRVSFGRTETEAIEEAEKVLSDPVRFGVLLMAEGTERFRNADQFTRVIQDFTKALQETVKHPNRGVPYGDDLPLGEVPR